MSTGFAAGGGAPMWLWIGVGLASFTFVSLLVALAFARALGAVNGQIELLEEQATEYGPLP